MGGRAAGDQDPLSCLVAFAKGWGGGGAAGVRTPPFSCLVVDIGRGLEVMTALPHQVEDL